MNVFFYANEKGETRNQLEALVEKTVKADQRYRSDNLPQMIDRLRSDVHSQDIVILLLATAGELDEFLREESLFDDIRLILILPINDPELVAKGHLLRPRFVDIAPDHDFSKVEAVLTKMLSPSANPYQAKE